MNVRLAGHNVEVLSIAKRENTVYKGAEVPRGVAGTYKRVPVGLAARSL